MVLHLVSNHFATNNCLRAFREHGVELCVLVFGESCDQVNNSILVTECNREQIAKSIDFTQVTHCIIHFITNGKVRFVKDFVPENIPVIWWTYGGDLYLDFLAPRGYRVSYNNYYLKYDFSKYRYLNIIYAYIREKWNYYVLTHKGGYQRYIINRVCGFIPCIKPDYDLACNYLKKDLQLIRIHPFAVRRDLNNTFSRGNDISVGHSASPTDNHLYALKFLNKLSLRDSNIILTLSYTNDNPSYTENVKEVYKQFYGEKVTFIEKLLPKEVYFESLLSYKAMILPSWRQEALANVVACFRQGIKLFLSNRSPLYNYFRQIGFIVFCIEEMDQESLDTPLSLSQQEYNSQLLLKMSMENEAIMNRDLKKFFIDMYPLKTNKE